MPAGRPTDYREEYCDQAYKLCLLGATDAEMAGFFEVNEKTINNWKNAHPEFLQSIKAGKKLADTHLAHKLFSRAEGAEWTEQQAFKVKVGPHEEKVEIVEVKRAAPPDTTALIFWLKNRAPSGWRDKQEHEHAGAGGGPLVVEIVRFGDAKDTPA